VLALSSNISQTNVLGPLGSDLWVSAYKQMCLAPWRATHG